MREAFGNRFVFIAAGIGMAVGAGNIWRFPRVAAEFGGGTFLLILLLANLIWAIPILMAEALIGNKTRLGTVGAIRDYMGRNFAWVGAWLALVASGIMFYYTVITGWGLRYFTYAVTGSISEGVDSQALWDGFTGSPSQTILFQLIAVVGTSFIVLRGLKGGIESVLRVVIPALFVLLIAMTLRAVTLPGAGEGLRYLFVPEFARFGNPQVWIEAFTQAAFSTGAGWGLLLTYAVYTRDGEDVSLNCSALAFGNLFASLLAGTTILCSVYALRGQQFAEEALAAGSQGLAFVYFVELLAEMPGSAIFAPLFFLAFTLATVSTLISIFELGIMNLKNLGLGRPLAVLVVGGVSFALGIPSAIWIGFLDNQDFVWGVGLLISGTLMAIAIIRYGVERMRAEINAVSDLHVGRWWSACILLAPVFFVGMLLWWIYLSIAVYAPDSWWNPFSTFSTATMLVQWAILFGAVYSLNSYLAKKAAAGPLSDPSQSRVV